MSRTIVVDSSVVVKWMIPEELSAEAGVVLSEAQAGNADLIAPELLVAEVGNVLWKQHNRGYLSTVEMTHALSLLHILPIFYTNNNRLIDLACNLAVAHQRSVYDMLYVALSVQQSCLFLTADKRLVNAVSAILPQVQWIGDWKP